MTNSKKGLIFLITGMLIFIGTAFIAILNFGDFPKPQKVIIVRFGKMAPVLEKLTVYYNGIEIGKVTKTDFSDDYKYTLFKVEIDRKNFNPPKNIYAEIRITTRAQIKVEGVDLKRYMEFIYPENPDSKPLSDGDIIEGRPTYREDFQEIFKKSVKKEKIEAVLENINKAALETSKITENFYEISKKINDFLKKNQDKIDKIVNNSNETMENIRSVSTTIKEFSEIPAKEKGLKSMLADVSEITENINILTSDVNEITGNPAFQCGLITTSSNLGNITSKIDQNLEGVDIKCLLRNTDRVLNRYDCVGASLSELMTKRALILRLMFGNPGECFGKCTKY